MKLDLFNNLVNNVKESGLVQNFIKELSDVIENKNSIDIANNSQKYSNYWAYKNFMEEDVAASIGISRWATDITYSDELRKAIDDSILELSESEGILYRKKFTSNGPLNKPTFIIDKFENGMVEHLTLSRDKVPTGFDNEDIIFQYEDDGTTKVRMDLKDKAIKRACEKVTNLKTKENEKTIDFKREGHIYEAFEDDGYIFLNDLTEEREYSLEDIDFVVDRYEGEGKYQVIDGKYKKIDD